MKVVGKFSLKNAESVLKENYLDEYNEILEVIESIDAETCKNKVSREKTKAGKILYSPKCLNERFKAEFVKRGWNPVKVKIEEYSKAYYVNGYSPSSGIDSAYREMDFVKNKVGVEVQFGKYAFMVYNVAAKMTIFHKLGYIDVGVEIVPVKEMQARMSTGVSFFEQLVWDLEHRGEADIDIPVLVLGIISDKLLKNKSHSTLLDYL